MITDSSVLTRSRRSSARVLITTESNSCLGQTISGELTKGPRMLSNEGRSFRCVLREREETFHMVSPIDHAKKFFFKYGCRIIVATGITFSKFLDFSLIKKTISVTKCIQNVRSSGGFWPQLTAVLSTRSLGLISF